MEYPCTGCGACCRRINIVIDNLKELDSDNPLYFPYKAKENGHCEMLSKENKCMVYENRPLVCNIENLASFLNVPKIEFYCMNIAFCNTIMDEDNLPIEYRII